MEIETSWERPGIVSKRQFTPTTIRLHFANRDDMRDFFEGLGKSTGKQSYVLYKAIEKILEETI